MKFIFYSLILVVLSFLSWSWNKPLPKLFLIGDSISIQYGPYLEKYLEGTVVYERKQDDGQADKARDLQAAFIAGFLQSYIRKNL